MSPVTAVRGKEIWLGSSKLSHGEGEKEPGKEEEEEEGGEMRGQEEAKPHEPTSPHLKTSEPFAVEKSDKLFLPFL